MLNITFFEVGQGDAILIKWDHDGFEKIGIIDCNKFKSSNKIVDYLKANSVTTIEFIVLSHFHYDHFSGLNDIFEYCIENKVKIKSFIHTFISQILDIYDRIFYSKKVEYEIERFIDLSETIDVDDIIIANCNLKDFHIADDIIVSFYAPDGKAYHEIAKNISRKKLQKTTTATDINKLATIIKILHDDEYLLLTSDANKKSFTKIRDKINGRLILTQVPHHGSFGNIDEKFWDSLDYSDNCPAVFSVGYELKDKLPHINTVDFFSTKRFKIFSTNCVFGIKEYFENTGYEHEETSTITCLDLFSTKINTYQAIRAMNTQFSGDKTFNFFD